MMLVLVATYMLGLWHLIRFKVIRNKFACDFAIPVNQGPNY